MRRASPFEVMSYNAPAFGLLRSRWDGQSGVRTASCRLCSARVALAPAGPVAMTGFVTRFLLRQKLHGDALSVADWIRLSRLGEVYGPLGDMMRVFTTWRRFSLLGGRPATRTAESSRLLSLPDGKGNANIEKVPSLGAFAPAMFVRPSGFAGAAVRPGTWNHLARRSPAARISSSHFFVCGSPLAGLNCLDGACFEPCAWHAAIRFRLPQSGYFFMAVFLLFRFSSSPSHAGRREITQAPPCPGSLPAPRPPAAVHMAADVAFAKRRKGIVSGTLSPCISRRSSGTRCTTGPGGPAVGPQSAFRYGSPAHKAPRSLP